MKCEFFIKHSFTNVKKYVLSVCFFGILAFNLFIPQQLKAQMFSVGDDPVMRNVPRTAFYLGLEPAGFSYRGPAGGGEYEFDGPLLRLRLESPGLNLFLATGGRLTGLDDITYFDAGIKVNYGLNIVRSEKLLVNLPVQLTTNLTSAVNRNVVGLNTQFQQGALVAGAGAALHWRPAPRVRFEANFIPSYGFSFATGNTFGGSLGVVEGQARMYLDRLFGEMGLSFGYDYSFKRYNIEEDAFDYDLSSHGILVGITF